ncbi:MAG: LacI family DNA-binding transcriptional regulator [Nibricoccus sp.]
MPTPRPTVRSLAAALGLSRATISNVLRGKGRVAAETIERVRKAAAEAGYAHNALAGALMSELRQSRGQTFRGVIATVDRNEPERAPHGPFHAELVKGIRERAGELGYRLEEFVVGGGGLSMNRLNAVLDARGIQGVVVLPSWHEPDWAGIDWSRRAGVYTDYIIRKPALNCVTTDPYKSMVETLERLSQRGYRRPGLFIERERDSRTHFRFCAPFQSILRDGKPRETVPPLLVAERDRETFARWFSKHRPDVVLSHFNDALEWMKALGARVPETHGFVSLNELYREEPCAALDLQPRLIGARSLDILTGQLQRQELGVPAWPTLTTVSARWLDGPTVRRSLRENGANQKVSPGGV